MYSSDMERSQPWQQQQQQQQQYASAERQSQSGWFPLEDALLVSSQPQIVYDTDEQLLAPQHHQQQQQQQDPSGRWVAQPTATADHPYVHDVGRLSIPSRPDPVMYPQQQQAQAYVTIATSSSSSQEMGVVSAAHTGGGAGAYASWPQDSRLSGLGASVSGVIVDQFEDQYLDRSPHLQYPPAGIAAMVRSQSLQQQHMYQNQSSHPPPRSGRKAKEISIGRWNADEHKWFLKGLEMFQGPAWGEIARLIGTRTSTQVRTHAQKFFTKLARMNQTLPYFDAQIQKERARLLAQGALGSTSVTPTSTSGSGGFNYALSNLSPRKRVSGGSSPSGGTTATTISHHLKRDPQESDCTTNTTSSSSLYGSSNSGGGIPLPSEYHPSQSRMAEYDDQVRSGGGGMAYYHHAAAEDNNSSNELFKPKYDPSVCLSPLLRKPRMYIDANGHPVSAAASVADPVAQGYDSLHPHHHHHQYQQQHLGYATHAKDELDASRQQHFVALDASQLSHDHQHQQEHQQLPRADDMGYGILHTGAAADPWGGDDPAQRHWVALPSSHADTSNIGGGSSLDADSLPSMNKLLYRGAAA
ncbi:Lhy protein [Globisporangium polare]